MIENTTKYSLKLLSNVHKAVFTHFDYDFTLRQLAALVTRQPQKIKDDLEVTSGDDGTSVDALIDEIGKKITGFNFPFPGASDTLRHKFYIKFNMRKDKYFENIHRIKQ